MKRLLLLILNTITFLVVIFTNYYAGSGGFNGKSVSNVSDKYDTLFTPAAYTFGIWGFIYLSLFLFVGFQWYNWKRDRETSLPDDIGPWFAIANLANAAWVVVWTQEMTGLSVVLMFVLLYALVKLVIRLELETWDAPVRIIAFVWWPVCWYLGWIILAAVTNVAAYLTSIHWSGRPLSETIWTIIMMLFAVMAYLILIYKRNLREASLVGIWGISGILVKQWGINPMIVYFSAGAIIILFVASAYHGYKNRYFSPANKWKRGEL